MPAQRGSRYYGNLGENYAYNLLRSHGYKILQRNFRSKTGEIDIVAIEGDTLVFVEVKTRWSKKFGLPEEAVTKRKLYRIRKTGEYFSLTHPTLPKKLRIEVVAIEVVNGKVSSARIIKAD